MSSTSNNQTYKDIIGKLMSDGFDRLKEAEFRFLISLASQSKISNCCPSEGQHARLQEIADRVLR